MRLLFVTSRFPSPPLRGDQVRAHHMLRVLGRRHAVTLVCVGDPRPGPDDIAAVGASCDRIVVVPHPRAAALAGLASAPFRRLPLQVGLLQSAAIGRAIAEAARHADVALVQLVRMAPYHRRLGDLPSVLDMVDALSVNMTRRASGERGALRPVVSLEARFLRRYERVAQGRFSRTVAVSDADAAALGLASDHVVPNGVDAEHFAFAPPGVRAPRIVCVGNMGYFPNVQGVTWFAEEVMPRVRARVPAATLEIVGARPAAAVQRLGTTPGITVTGRVPDVVPHLHAAAVAIAPLRSGTGLQNKVLEAMAAGTPMVATPHAVAGVAAVHGRHLLVASGAEETARTIAGLLMDPARGAALAAEARRLVDARYSWERSVDALEGHLDAARAARR